MNRVFWLAFASTLFALSCQKGTEPVKVTAQQSGSVTVASVLDTDDKPIEVLDLNNFFYAEAAEREKWNVKYLNKVIRINPYLISVNDKLMFCGVEKPYTGPVNLKNARSLAQNAVFARVFEIEKNETQTVANQLNAKIIIDIRVNKMDGNRLQGTLIKIID